MFLKSVLLLFLSVFGLSVFAQNDTLSVDFLATWKKGDSQRYKVTKTKIEQKNVDSVKTTTEAYISNFIVEEASENGYTVHWKMEEKLTRDKELPKELSEVIQKHADMQLKYRTAPSGEFLEILGWQEMSKMMLESFNSLLKSEKNIPGLSKMMEPVKQAFSSKEGIESVVFKELQIFHFMYGVTLTNKDTLLYNDHLPNFFGGDPIKAVGKVYITDVDVKNKVCKIAHTLTPDNQDVQKMFEDVIINFSKSAKFKNNTEKKAKLAEIKAAVAQMNVNMYDTAVIQYDYQRSLPLKINKTRFINLKTPEYTSKREDIVIIESVK